MSILRDTFKTHGTQICVAAVVLGFVIPELYSLRKPNEGDAVRAVRAAAQKAVDHGDCSLKRFVLGQTFPIRKSDEWHIREMRDQVTVGAEIGNINPGYDGRILYSLHLVDGKGNAIEDDDMQRTQTVLAISKPCARILEAQP